MLQEPMLAEVLVPFVRGFAGGGAGTVETLVGDASTRRYHRVRVVGGEPPTAIVMELPDEPLKSDEATAGARPAELPFLNVQRYLAAGGYPVPRVYKADLARGLVGLEDLGDRTFESAVTAAPPAARAPLYRAAIDQIVALQELGARVPDPACVAFSRRFDERLLRWELGHFREWYLEAQRGVVLPAAASATVEAAFDWIASVLAAEPVTLVHRDFQSRNLMLVDGESSPSSASPSSASPSSVSPSAASPSSVSPSSVSPSSASPSSVSPSSASSSPSAASSSSSSSSSGPELLRVIDFQDALLGTRAYDLVALLRDSYVELTPGELDALVSRFVARAGIADEAAFRRLFTLQTLQRKLKDAGRFVFIDRVRNNPSFLRWIPTTIKYVRDALAAAPAELSELAQVLGEYAPELGRRE